MNRIVINSENLKKEFADIYRNFYSDSDLVVSLNNTFNIAGHTSWRIGGPVLIKNYRIEAI